MDTVAAAVWPNIVYMVSEEIGRRSRRGREKACLICHQRSEFAGNNMEHNLFHCPLAHHASDEIDLAAWQAMVSHPFRMQSGAKRIDQQLCYLGSLLQVWENAADVGMVTPWTLVLISLVSCFQMFVVLYDCVTCRCHYFFVCSGQTTSSASPRTSKTGRVAAARRSCTRATQPASLRDELHQRVFRDT